MKFVVLAFIGIALIFCVQGGEICDNTICPDSFDDPEATECCRYFRDACCTHEENENLKTIFIVVIVVSVLIFIGVVACVVGIIACCVCAATPTRSTRTVVSTTPYAPVGPNVVVANSTTNTVARPI